MQTAQRSPRTVIEDPAAGVDLYRPHPRPRPGRRRRQPRPHPRRSPPSQAGDRQTPSRELPRPPLDCPTPPSQQVDHLTLPKKRALLPRTPPCQLELDAWDQPLAATR